MKVVLDCNVVVSAARAHGTCLEVIDSAVREHDIVFSRPILFEYLEVAGQRSQAPYRQTMEFVIREIERLAIVVEPAEVVFGVRDSDDDVYFATAVTGGATLITSNKRDFTQARYRPVEVWTPRDFWIGCFESMAPQIGVNGGLPLI